MTVGTKVKETLANLKSAQGTLRIYINQTQDGDTKSVYEDALKTTSEVIKDIEDRIKTLEFEEPQYKGYK